MMHAMQLIMTVGPVTHPILEATDLKNWYQSFAIILYLQLKKKKVLR